MKSFLNVIIIGGKDVVLDRGVPSMRKHMGSAWTCLHLLEIEEFLFISGGDW
jgi:hypothetical protein